MSAVKSLLAVLALSATVGLSACTPNEFESMSCSELTVEMLKMTDWDATEPYDLDRVRAINDTRHEKGCVDDNGLPY